MLAVSIDLIENFIASDPKCQLVGCCLTDGLFLVAEIAFDEKTHRALFTRPQAERHFLCF